MNYSSYIPDTWIDPPCEVEDMGEWRRQWCDTCRHLVRLWSYPSQQTTAAFACNCGGLLMLLPDGAEGNRTNACEGWAAGI